MSIKVKVNGGLGNRMRVMNSCLQLSKALNTTIDVIWERNRYLNCSFDRLFKPIPGLHIQDLPYLPSWVPLLGRLRNQKFESEFQHADQRFTDHEIKSMLDRNADMERLVNPNGSVYISSCEHFYGKTTSVQDLVPVDALSARADALRSHLGEAYTGIHIRRGDHKLSSEKSPLILFQNKLDELIRMHPTEHVFLCTDDQHIADQLKREYPQIIYPKQVLSRKSPQGIEDALVNLLVLSGARKIYGSYWSSFSEIAALLGNVDLTVLSKGT